MKMKKLIAYLLVLVMIFGLVGCGAADTADDNAGQSANTSNAGNTTNDDVDQAVVDGTKKIYKHITEVNPDAPTGFKIGFVYTPPTGALSQAFYNSIDYIAEAFGCETMFINLTSYGTEDWVNAYENLVQQGADALIILTGSTPALLEELNEKGVYYCVNDAAVTDEMRAIAEGSPYFCGFMDNMSTGSDYSICYQGMQALYDAGCRKVAYVAHAVGGITGDIRAKGYEDFIAEHPDMELLAFYRGNDFTTAITDIIATYGDQLDGIATAASADTLAAAVITGGYEDSIKISAYDIGADDADLIDMGMQVCTGGGNADYFMMYFIMLYNKLSGGDTLFADNLGAVPLPQGFIMKSASEVEDYMKYMVNDYWSYSASDLMKLCSVLYPDTTVEEKEDLYNYYMSYEYNNPTSAAARYAAENE